MASAPVPYPCGGNGQRPCPPKSAVTPETEAAVHAYGDAVWNAAIAWFTAQQAHDPALDGPEEQE